MKNKKEFKANLLIAEVVKALQGDFRPPIGLVKEQIAHVEKNGFITRHPDDQNILVYVP